MNSLPLFSLVNVAEQIVLSVLGIGSIISLAIVLERWFFLRRLTKDSREILLKIEMNLSNNSLKIIEDVAKLGDTIINRACQHAIKHIHDSGEHGLSELFHSYTITVRPKLEKSLSYLGSIGSNAPYVGLSVS